MPSRLFTYSNEPSTASVADVSTIVAHALEQDVADDARDVDRRRAKEGCPRPAGLDVVHEVGIRGAHQEAEIVPHLAGAALNCGKRLSPFGSLKASGYAQLRMTGVWVEGEGGFQAFERAGQRHSVLEMVLEALGRVARARFLRLRPDAAHAQGRGR